MVAEISPGSLSLRLVHRFTNAPLTLPDGLHWRIQHLRDEVLTGLRAAAASGREIASIGIDSWGVDYGLLGADDQLLEQPFHYRDSRNERGVIEVHSLVQRERLYARTGIQFLPFNTIYQLAAAHGTEALGRARRVLLIPDLFAFWLSGVARAEMTNASTTAMLDARTLTWATDLLKEVGISDRLLPDLAEPGAILGPLLPAMSGQTALGTGTQVTLVGSHDTASAVAAVPARDIEFAFISCGTWSLVGLELERPVLTEASRTANFTNERGVDGRVRYLRNVMGLWLLQETLRAWEGAGSPADLPALLAAAADLGVGGPVIDADDPMLLAPGDMPARIVQLCERTDQRRPASRPELVRCILESLGAAHARALRDAMRLSGRRVRVVHLVGGGSRNDLLCQLTADACGLPVVAGPAEATAMGNALIQARAHGLIDGTLETLRGLVGDTQPVRRYEPHELWRTPLPSPSGIER